MDFKTIGDKFTYGYNYIQPKALSFVKALNDKRNNIPELYKTLQVAIAATDLWNTYLSGLATTFLPSLKNVQILTVFNPRGKTVADMFFFWGFMQQPRNWRFPVTAASVDSRDALRQLEEAIKAKFPYEGGGNDPHQFVRAPQQAFVVKSILKQQLDTMVNSKGYPAYRNAQEFADALANRFEACGVVSVNTEKGKYKIIPKPTDIDLSYDLAEFAKEVRKMKFIVAQPSILETITNLNWLAVDLGTTTMFLKFWNILDTSRISNALGNISVFGKNPFAQPLEVFVRASICTGCVLSLANTTKAWYQLPENGRDPYQVRKLKLDATSAATDVIYHGTCFVKEAGIKAIPQPCIDALSIVVRSIGIFCINKQPAPAYTRILR